MFELLAASRQSLFISSDQVDVVNVKAFDHQWTFDNSYVVVGCEQRIDFLRDKLSVLSIECQKLECFECSRKDPIIYYVDDGMMKIYNYEKSTLVDQIQIEAKINSIMIRVNMEESHAILVEQRKVHLLSITTKQLVFLDCITPKNDVTSAEFSYFKKSLFAIGDEDGYTHLCDYVTKTTAEFPSHSGPIRGVAFSPYNRFLLSSAALDGRIVLYDVEKKSVVKSIKVDCPITCLSFRHDGVTLAAGTLKGRVIFFDLRAGSKPKGEKVLTEDALVVVKFSNKPKGRFSRIEKQGLISSVTSTTPKQTESPNVSLLDIFSPVAPQKQPIPATVISSKVQNLFSPAKEEEKAKENEEEKRRVESFEDRILKKSSTESNSSRSLKSTRSLSGIIHQTLNEPTKTQQPPSQQLPVLSSSSMSVADKMEILSYIDNVKEEIIRDVKNLHLDLLRQFHLQKLEIADLLSKK